MSLTYTSYEGGAYIRSRNRERTRANQSRKKFNKIETISWTRPVNEDRSLYFMRAVSLLVNRTAQEEEKKVYLDDMLEPELKLATRGVLKQGFIKRRKRVEKSDINMFRQAVEGSLNGSRTSVVEMTLGDFRPELDGRNGRLIVSLAVKPEAEAYELLANSNREVRNKWWEITDSRSKMPNLTPRIDIAQVGSQAAGDHLVGLLTEDEIVVEIQRKTGRPTEQLSPSEIPVVLEPAVEYPIRLKSS